MDVAGSEGWKMEEREAGADGQPGPGGGPKRQVSSIAFPYDDLDEAIRVATSIHSNGGLQATVDQLAAWLGHDSISSGAFRTKLSVARLFGLIDVERDRVVLTPLGRSAIDPQKAQAARVQAFLKVPLYHALYERYRGNLLPRDVGLEQDIVSLGVSQKQKERARQVFQRSAQQAGLFAHGKDRLVLPAGMSVGLSPNDASAAHDGAMLEHVAPARHPSEDAVGGHLGPNGLSVPPTTDLHPAIQGLLLMLPAPNSVWPQEKRSQWIEALKAVLGVVYEDGG